MLPNGDTVAVPNQISCFLKKFSNEISDKISPEMNFLAVEVKM